MDKRMLFIPLELAELLHATLGPLSEILDKENHPWSAMVRRVIEEYTHQRNRFLTPIHGNSVVAEISHHTYLASEKVCELTDSAISEAADFLQWANEVGGDNHL